MMSAYARSRPVWNDRKRWPSHLALCANSHSPPSSTTGSTQRKIAENGYGVWFFYQDNSVPYVYYTGDNGVTYSSQAIDAARSGDGTSSAGSSTSTTARQRRPLTRRRRGSHTPQAQRATFASNGNVSTNVLRTACTS